MQKKLFVATSQSVKCFQSTYCVPRRESMCTKRRRLNFCINFPFFNFPPVDGVVDLAINIRYIFRQSLLPERNVDARPGGKICIFPTSNLARSGRQERRQERGNKAEIRLTCAHDGS
jgi:hypothetical protein